MHAWIQHHRRCCVLWSSGSACAAEADDAAALLHSSSGLSFLLSEARLMQKIRINNNSNSQNKYILQIINRTATWHGSFWVAHTLPVGHSTAHCSGGEGLMGCSYAAGGEQPGPLRGATEKSGESAPGRRRTRSGQWTPAPLTCRPACTAGSAPHDPFIKYYPIGYHDCRGQRRPPCQPPKHRRSSAALPDAAAQ